jgi:hypothetical protein
MANLFNFTLTLITDPNYYKWIRIIFRCWKNHEIYDEMKYIKTLKRHGSDLFADLVKHFSRYFHNRLIYRSNCNTLCTTEQP